MIDSTNYLDPEFVKDLQETAKLYDANQECADDNAWHIARLVNDMWPEHKTLTYPEGGKVFETKEEFLVACSFAVNSQLKKKRFSDSGQTLRRWCEVNATYNQLKGADELLTVLSFEHLRIAKSLAYNEKVKGGPVVALARAVKEKWTADEMREHYDPPTKPTLYDVVKGHLTTLVNYKSFEFLKSVENKKACIGHAQEIQRIIESEVLAEGKAV
jgi:hypothetical protein